MYLHIFRMSHIIGESSEAPDGEDMIPLREEDLDDAFALEVEQKEEKKFMSIILNNLHVNFEAWRAEKDAGEGEKKTSEDEVKEKEQNTADDEKVSSLANCK